MIRVAHCTVRPIQVEVKQPHRPSGMFQNVALRSFVTSAITVAAACASAQDSAPRRDPFGSHQSTRSSNGVDGISTGNKTLDILLNARIAPGEAASSAAAGVGAATTAVDSGPAPVVNSDSVQASRGDGSPDSLKQGLILDAASQMRLDPQSSESEQKRLVERDTPGASPGQSIGGRAGARQQDGHPGGADGLDSSSFILPREFVMALREHRYLILGLASACALAVWWWSARATSFRPDPSKRSRHAHAGRAEKPGHRRRHKH